MKRYEYRIEQIDITKLGKPELTTRLDSLGAEGWNLVTAISHEKHGYSHEVNLMLSRVVEE